MPIPFLLIGIGAITGVVGAGKSVKAAVDQKDAKQTNSSAKSIVETAKSELDHDRKNSGAAITHLGEDKIAVLDIGVKPFIAAFEKLHNIETKASVGLDEPQKFRLDKQSFVDLKDLQIMASSIAGGVAGGAALGAATAFGAYGAAMTFGASSTGTAISALSGAAATNATLAFLGGGSLAAGGLGIAGGTAVLGGLVAGPALAIMGFIVGAKASANKEKAYANLAEANKFREEAKTASAACRAIRLRAELFSRMLMKLDALFEPLVYSLQDIIETAGTDYSTYSDDQKATVAASLSLAGAIKSIIDTPILTEDGKLTSSSMDTVQEVNELIEGMNK